VTLSVTRGLHPGYPRFHEACRPLVFGLSSGENKFKPAIACHSMEGSTDQREKPGKEGWMDGWKNGRMDGFTGGRVDSPKHPSFHSSNLPPFHSSIF
jgi:hypothetical protein